MELPLVTVICLSYNHKRFVREAIESILQQTYSNIEIIVIDDASTDGTADVVNEILNEHPAILFLPLARNHGNCAAFNKGLALAKGEFIIDFSADDIMVPGKIEHQVKCFQRLDRSYGVVFTDALYVDEAGQPVRKHFDSLFRRKLIKEIPEGDVYADVLSTFFIASPTMMVRREVFEFLGGYDEKLAYEDFDFWVRSSRKYKYRLLNEALMRIRITCGSLSTGLYKPGDKQLYSTYVVCRKAMELNRTEDERRSLIKRIQYEMRQAVFTENHHEARLFYQLLKENGYRHFAYGLLNVLNSLKLPLFLFRKMYHRIRYGL